MVWNQLYENDNFCFYLQNILIQTNQTGGQWYFDTFPFSIPWRKYQSFEFFTELLKFVAVNY